METTVRDKYHELSSKRVQERVREKTYSWHFETQIAVSRRTKSQYTSHLPRSADSKEKEPPAVTPSQPKTP
jgi:intergrase/recombinase